ncbi:hypothetical protein TTRE_0000069901 [Trichuris trichiura]|uniref:Uncharacterized protein n=1 Tax=Trichuris trichiura TaxID=36087 RepID=A0A077YYA7_TRITR|nr:hypothetical protein TTRE_0000069901 [Trichuris trichiura]
MPLEGNFLTGAGDRQRAYVKISTTNDRSDTPTGMDNKSADVITPPLEYSNYGVCQTSVVTSADSVVPIEVDAPEVDGVEGNSDANKKKRPADAPSCEQLKLKKQRKVHKQHDQANKGLSRQVKSESYGQQWVTSSGRPKVEQDGTIESTLRRIREESSLSQLGTQPVLSQSVGGLQFQRKLPYIAPAPWTQTGQQQSPLNWRTDNTQPGGGQFAAWNGYMGIPRSMGPAAAPAGIDVYRVQGNWTLRNEPTPQTMAYPTPVAANEDDGMRFLTIKVPAASDVEIIVKGGRR